MKENSIITLEDKNEYIILDKIHLDDKIYYFCTLLGYENKTAGDKVKFFVSKKENNDYFLAEVQDKEIKNQLIKIVRNLA